ncbi:MAG: hypothetical protein ACYCYF_00860 [Anaerolineae bacterium]
MRRALGILGNPRQTRAYGWLLVTLLSLPVVVPTLTRSVEDRSTDIAAFHIYRGMQFSDALDSGWLYPRWASALNDGLGSPLFSFYSPGAYYAADGLRRLGLPPNLAWRSLLALAALAASLGAFELVLALARQQGLAVLAATTYLYAPALLRDLWQRGSPQGFVTALLPWALLALLRLAERPSGVRVAVVALALASLVLLHNASALITLPVLVLFTIYLALSHGFAAARHLLVASILGALLATIHMAPVLLERSIITFDRVTWEGADPAEAAFGPDDLQIWPADMDTGISNQNRMNCGRVDVVQLGALLACSLVGAFGLRRAHRSSRFLWLGSILLCVLAISLQFD